MIRRKTIGVVIDTLDGVYEKELIKFISKRAYNQNYNVVFASGKALRQKNNRENGYNTIFKLLGSPHIDAILLLLSTLDIYQETIALKEIIEDYKDIPLVSFTIPIEGAFTVKMNNYEASFDVVKHMIGVHGYRRIAYVSGPKDNMEVQERYSAFLKVLDDHGIKDHFYFEGNFLMGSGQEAVDAVMAQSDTLPDAFICANDVMAAGVYIRLLEKGIKVPNDVALCGFDNVEISKAFFPAFTTVTQPIEEMCEIAFSHFRKIFSQVPVKSVTNANATGQLVVRESCGCLSLLDNKKSFGANTKKVKNHEHYLEQIDQFEEMLLKSKKSLVPELAKHLHVSTNMQTAFGNRIASIIDVLIEDVEKDNKGSLFLDAYYRLLVFGIHEIKAEYPWVDFIGALRDHILLMVEQSQLKEYLEKIFFKACQMTANQMVSREVNHQFNIKEMYLLSRETIEKLNEVKNYDQLFQVLNNVLPEYGIRQCYICLYPNPIYNKDSFQFKMPKQVNANFIYFHGEWKNGDAFDTEDILPGDYINQIERYELVALALFDEHTQYGYMVIGLDGADLLIYETLRSQISYAIRNTILYTARIEAENILKETNKLLVEISTRDELTKLLNRRGFYQTFEKYIEIVEDGFCIIFGDLDYLKMINDNYGHQEGDAAILNTAKILLNTLHSDDIIARMSGDEFVAVVKGISSEEEAKRIVQKIATAFELSNFKDQRPYELSISLGYSLYDASLSIDDMLKEADKRLYEAKIFKKRLATLN